MGNFFWNRYNDASFYRKLTLQCTFNDISEKLKSNHKLPELEIKIHKDLVDDISRFLISEKNFRVTVGEAFSNPPYLVRFTINW